MADAGCNVELWERCLKKWVGRGAVFISCVEIGGSKALAELCANLQPKWF